MTTSINFVDRDEAIALAAISAIEAEIARLVEQVEKARADLIATEQTFRNLRESLAGKPST